MRQKGSILIMAIVFTGVFLIIVVGLLQYVTVLQKSSVAEDNRERAFQVAESGIDFYQWVLAHDREDYCIGTADPCPQQATHGPFLYEYKDPTGSVVGHYELYVDEPPLGSTIVTVRSTGWLDSNPDYTRTIEAHLGVPSLANYLFLCNSNMAFSETSHTYGSVFSNGGIRFDGENFSTVESARENYWCQPFHGCSPPAIKTGVWGTGGPQDLWVYPNPEIVFANYLSDFNALRSIAQDDNAYLPPSPRQGYHLTLLPGGQVQIKVVRNASENGINHEEDYDPAIIPFPANGVIFVEDDLWVDGVVDGRLTIAAAEFPVDTGNVNIVINGNINYANGMGTDAFGLISQQDIELGRWLPDYTNVYAAMFAQKGKIYRDTNNNIINERLDLYGSLIYNETGYFKKVWQDWVVSGYRDTYYHFDANMVFFPPPHWPTRGAYSMINWQEL
jgi:hypothetical protein